MCTQIMKNTDIKYKSDTLYAHPNPSLENFSFNEQVVDVFPDMINRSVPGYTTIINGIGKIARYHCKDKSLVYDLGCSLGSVSLSIAKHTANASIKIIGIDNSLAMIEKCKQHILAYNYGSSIELQHDDLVALSLQDCDLVVINFTLQFVAPELRQKIINKVYNSLQTGGMLILSEKVKHPSHEIDDLLVDLHHEFKRDNGYSELEISQKRSALEDVMKLDTLECHQQRLLEAGFKSTSVWFQHFNFLSLLAIK